MWPLPAQKYRRDRESPLIVRDMGNRLSDSFQLVTGRVWKGSAFGGVKGRSEIPGIVEGKLSPSRSSASRNMWCSSADYLNGTLWVDEFVTHHQPLEQINAGFEDMHKGDCIRCVVNMGFE